MRETLKNIYDTYYWARFAAWMGLVAAALLIYWLEGGVPPPTWLLLWQLLHSPSLTRAVNGNLTLPLIELVFVSLVWLVTWILFCRVCLLVLLHHRGLRERLARRSAWQTTRHISELDAFALPGGHTLTLPMLDDLDEETNAEGKHGNHGNMQFRPPIRLPQYAPSTPLAQASHEREQGTRQQPIVLRASAQQGQSRPQQRAANATGTAGASSPVALRENTLVHGQREPGVIRSLEKARAEKTASSAVRRSPVTPVAVEDIPTTPEPPTKTPRRTTRLDTSVHSPVVAPMRSSATSATLEAGIGWHTGLTRSNRPNEDSVVVLRGMCTYREQLVPFGLFVVADGMGGHDCGQEASRIAIRTLAQHTLRDIMQPETLDDKQLVELLARAVEQANQAIYQRGKETHKDMGTTLTAALVVDTPESAMAYIVNTGDSRTYLLGKNEQLQQITRDHSLVANLVAAGAIKPDDIYTHPERNKVYRSLGNNASVEIDWFTRELRSGDTLLLCSDGLWEMVRDPDIERILRQDTNPTTQCNRLIQAALQGGGADNISAIVVKIA